MNEDEELEKKNATRSCRTCKHFHRCDSEGGLRNIQNTRGFCILGQLDGSFSLYVSDSCARKCMAYVEEDYNAGTYQLERVLNNKISDFHWKMGDRRSNVYKLLKSMQPESEALKKFFGADARQSIILLMTDKGLSEVLMGWFFEKNIELYKELGNRRVFSHQQYYELVGRITKAFHEEFEGGGKNEKENL